MEWPSLRGWRRIAFLGVIVSLPVPLLAASGLAVPLPSIVYRVAIGLAERTQAVAVGVPGFDALVAGTTELPRRGMIRLSPQELAEARSAQRADGGRSAMNAPIDGEEPARRVLATTTSGANADDPPSVGEDEAGWTDASETAAATAAHPAAEAVAEPSPEARDVQSHISSEPTSDRPEPPATGAVPRTSEPRTAPPDNSAPRAEPAPSSAPKSQPSSPKDEATVAVPGVPADSSDASVDATPPASTPGRSGDHGGPSSQTPAPSSSRGDRAGRSDSAPAQPQEPAVGAPAVDAPAGQPSDAGTGRPDAPPAPSSGSDGDAPQPPSELPTPPETPGPPPKGQRKE